MDQAPIVAGVSEMLPHFAATGALLITTQQGAETAHTQLCTATLIAPDHVVTAAHCHAESARLGLWEDGAPRFAARESNPETEAEPVMRGSRRTKLSRQVWYTFCLLDKVSARLGPAQMGHPACTPGVLFTVHPNYRLPGPWDTGLVDAYDVGVVQLAAAVSLATPAVMATADDDTQLTQGAAVSIAGYGSTCDHAAFGPVAQPTGIKRCAQSRIGRYSAVEMTVGEPPCRAHKSFGDSGGPTFMQTAAGPRLIGITSRLLENADAALGTVDTRIDAVSTWVRDTAGLLADDEIGETHRSDDDDDDGRADVTIVGRP